MRRRVVLSLCTVTVLSSSVSGEQRREQSGSVARGRYLVNSIAHCLWCHSPLTKTDPAIPIAETLGSGDVLNDTPVVAPNITPDPETGIGRWTDTEVIRAIREGVSRDGLRLRNDHPYAYFSVMTDADAGALVAYLRSLKPIRKVLPRSAPARHEYETVQPPVSPAKESALGGLIERGAYLVQLGECLGCHTTTTKEQRPFRGMEFGGGRRFRLDKGYGIEISPDPAFTNSLACREGELQKIVASPNITSDPSGIAFYTEEIFITTLRTGRVAGIRPLSAAMPWIFFRSMTDGDLRAIFAYLRQLRPVRHRVANFEPPTFCPRCGRCHGLGELNEAKLALPAAQQPDLDSSVKPQER